MPENRECLEVHDLCFDAREPMTGRLDFSVVLKIMDLMDIGKDDQLEIFGKIQAVERKLKEWQKEDKQSGR